MFAYSSIHFLFFCSQQKVHVHITEPVCTLMYICAISIGIVRAPLREELSLLDVILGADRRAAPYFTDSAMS